MTKPVEEAFLPRQEYQRLTKNMVAKCVPAIRLLLKVATFKNVPIHVPKVKIAHMFSHFKRLDAQTKIQDQNKWHGGESNRIIKCSVTCLHTVLK